MEEAKTFLVRTGVEGGALPVPADIRSSAPEEPRPVVVVCPGFLGYKGWGFLPWVSLRLARAGFHAVTISFSHSGVDEDTGLIARPEEFAADTVGRELDDLGRVLDFVRSPRFPLPARGAPGLLGHSRGGSVCVIAAGRRRDIGALVTWSAPARLDRYTPRRRREWQSSGALTFNTERSPLPLRLDWSYYEDLAANRDRYDVRSRAAELEIPHLVVHGERDAAVSASEARALAGNSTAGKTRLELIPGCGHTFGAGHPMTRPTGALERAAALTLAWFERALGKTPPDERRGDTRTTEVPS